MTDWADEYDPADFRPKRKKRKKRISAITGKETSLTPELELQIACFTWYDKLCRLDRTLREKTRLYAINPLPDTPNIIQRDLAKRAGLRAGVWDAQFLDRRTWELSTTWIEFKALKGGLTDEQLGWFEWLRDTPVKCVEVRSVDEFIKVIG